MDVPGPLAQLGRRATDSFLGLAAFHGRDVSVLDRDLLELVAEATIGYLMQAAEQRGLGDELLTLLVGLTVDPVDPG